MINLLKKFFKIFKKKEDREVLKDISLSPHLKNPKIIKPKNNYPSSLGIYKNDN